MTNMSLKQQNNDISSEYDDGESMKPVAWMLIDKEWNDACRYFSVPMENAIPLYTAPRELSDAEIEGLYYQHFVIQYTSFEDSLKFARAILKKASEK